MQDEDSVPTSNLSSADQAKHNTSAHNECKYEAVGGVPVRRPSSHDGPRIGKVQEGEGTELGDQSVFHGHEHGRPCNCWGNDSDCVASVAMYTTVFSPL